MLQTTSLVSLNHGLADRRALARITDVKRIALAAEEMTNWLCRVIGTMSMRVGLGYLFSTAGNAVARSLRFVFATSDTAIVELTPNIMRVVINDALLSRPLVTSAVTNGTFNLNLAGWTQSDDAGATSSWASGFMQLQGNGTARAIRDQQVATLTPNLEHGIRIVVARGPVYLRIGSSQGDDSYQKETALDTGTHSIAIVPTDAFWIRLFSTQIPVVWVQNCTIEPAGVVSIPTTLSASDLQNVRYDQSGDVLYLAVDGQRQLKVERRGVNPGGRSWSISGYYAPDGPFQIDNVSTLTLAPSALTGNITVTASLPKFKPSHVGCLFSLTQNGQVQSIVASASSQTTPSVRVTGVGDERTVAVVISGDATGSTVDLQRSYDNASWASVPTFTWTADITASFADGLNNQIVFYRLILTTRVAPDNVTMTLRVGSGSTRGIVRVTDFTSSTSVGAEVLTSLGATTATAIWQEGSWSNLKGWPTSVRLHEGRLWWSGKNGIFGSISDAFNSFDETFLGDAGPINRTIGSGPVDTINWMVNLQRLILGAQGAEHGARSSSLDEPLTPTNFNIKAPSTQGSCNVEAVKVDQRAYFVNRSNCKLFELQFDVRLYDYLSSDMTKLVPELGRPGIVRMDVQRQPETRIHCVRSDGVALVLVLDKDEEVQAWQVVETLGFVEDVVVLPAISGTLDDQVYYVVRRTINGSTVRFYEKWAQEVECRGDQALCKLADAFVAYTGPPTTTIHAGHLEGQSVVVWADGQDIGTDDTTENWTLRYTVAGGLVTLPSPVSNAVVGLPYTARWKSAKLGSVSQAGSPLNRQKKIDSLGLIAADMHPKGLRFGADFDHLDDMPGVEDATAVGTATETDYDQNVIPFPGTWTTDARVCLQAQAPRSATVMGLTPYLNVY